MDIGHEGRRAAGHDDLGSPSITIRPLWPEKGHWTRKAPTMDTVEQALRTAHSPGAPEGLRRQALEVLEQFKRSNQCGEWAFQVLQQPGQPAESRHFALQVLSSLLRYKWREWSADVQQQFRAAVLGLLDLTGGTELFMLERVALLVSEVGERQYPQQWPNMLEELAMIWDRRGPHTAVVALTALRNIAEDCVDSDFNSRLPTGRRQDILSSLNAQLPTILPQLYAYMARIYETRATTVAAAEVLKAALQLLKRLVNWVGLELIFASEANFVDVFRSLTLEDPTRADAMECLRDLSARRFDNLDFLKQYMEKLEGTMSELQGQGHVWSSPEFCETVCTTLAGFLVNNLDRFVCEDSRFTTPQTLEQALLTRYLELMAQFLQLPSLRAALALLSGWAAVYRQEKLKACEAPAALLPVFLNAYCEKIVKLRYDEESGSFADHPMANDEFIDVEEYLSVLTQLRAAIAPIFKITADHYPHRAVDFLAEKLPALIAQYGSATDVTSTSDSYRHLESFANPLDRILGSIPEPDPNKPADVEMLNKISAMLTGLLEWRLSDPLLLYCHCLMLEAFRRFYRLLGAQLSAVLERLFQYMEYRDPALVGKTFSSPAILVKHLSQEALQVRRRGSNSMVEICNLVPDLMLPCLPSLCTRYRELMQKGEVSNAHKPQIIEMLVVVSNAIPAMAERTAFVTDLLRDILTFWTSPECTQMISSAANLLQSMGMRPDGTVVHTEDGYNQAWDSVHSLTGALGSFICAGRRIKVATQDDSNSKDNAVAEIGRALVFQTLSLDELARVNCMVGIWQIILPNVMLSLRTIHSLWQPDMRANLLALPQARRAMTMHQDELQMRLKAAGPRPAQAAVDSPDFLLKKWPMWLNQIRQNIYQCLEKACQQKVIYYSSAEILQRLEQTVLEDLPHMEHRHIPWFLKNVMEPYIIHCPQPLFASHLPPIMVPLMSHMVHRCSITWSPATATASLTDPAERFLVDGGLYILEEDGVSAEDYDTMQDKLKREVTRAYVELLQTVFGQRGGWKEAAMEVQKSQAAVVKSQKGGPAAVSPDGATSPPLQLSPSLKDFVEALCRFIITEHEELAFRLLLSILGALCWPDANSCRRAIAIAGVIITVGAREPKLYPALGQDLFRTLIHTILSEQKYVVGLQNELAALSCQIYRLLVLNEDIKDNGSGLPRPEQQPLCDLPRQELLKLPGLSPQLVSEMESKMLAKRAPKDQRDLFRDALKMVAQTIGDGDGGDRASKEESILRVNRFTDISNLPERILRRNRAGGKPEAEGLQGTVLSSLLGP